MHNQLDFCNIEGHYPSKHYEEAQEQVLHFYIISQGPPTRFQYQQISILMDFFYSKSLRSIKLSSFNFTVQPKPNSNGDDFLSSINAFLEEI